MRDQLPIQADEAARAAAHGHAVRWATQVPGATVGAITLRPIAAGEMPG